MDCKKSKCDCMQNHWDLVNKEKKIEKNSLYGREGKPIKELVFTTIEEGNISCVRIEDHLKVVEENKRLKSMNEIYINRINKFDRENKQLQSICNSRGEEIEELRNKLKEMTIHKDRVFMDVLELERAIEEMKNNVIKVKCCQGCAKSYWKQYLTYHNLHLKNTMEEYTLKEDCLICKWREGRESRTMKPCNVCKSPYSTELNEDKCEKCKEGFVDSWVLWYKVEGMNEAVQQFHLTKEECEIIYGNLTNLTYWHMEVMK